MFTIQSTINVDSNYYRTRVNYITIALLRSKADTKLEHKNGTSTKEEKIFHK